MSRRIFIIDDDEVAMEIAKMLKYKEMRRKRKRTMYDGGGNIVYNPIYVEEHYGGCGSVGCGATMSSCGMPINSGCGGGMMSSFGTCG